MKKLTYLLFLLIIISCSKSRQEDENILSTSLSSEVSTFDPAESYDEISGSLIYQCYETLFEYEYLKRPYTLKPLLAKDFPKIERNGLKYTFSIRENIRYHDDPSFKGQPRFLEAQDFINQIKRLAFKPTKSSGWWLFKDKVIGLNEFREEVGNDLKKMISTPVAGLKIINKHSFSIELKEAYPQLIYAMAMTFTSPVPKEAILFYKNNLSRNIVGTGPFFLKERKGPLLIKLRRFPHYRKAQYPAKGDRYAYERGLLKDSRKQIPFLEGIDFHVHKEAQTRWLNFLTKKVDFITLSKDHFQIAIDQFGRLSEDLREKSVQMQISPTLTYWWLAFNMQDPLLGKNKTLRKAIAHAVNIDKMISLFTNNVAQKANSLYPPGIPGYNPSHRLPYQYDVKEAKRLLAEAGFSKKNPPPNITFDVRGDSASSRQFAEFIQAELKKVGIPVTVSLNSFPRFLQKAREGKLQFWLGGWSLDYPDSENILQLLYDKNFPPGPNTTYFSNKDFNQHFKELIYLSNGPKKFAKMQKLENIVEEQLPWVMLYYSRNYILYHSRLKNFRHSDLNRNYLKFLKLAD